MTPYLINQLPNITIIIPVFNDPEGILTCLQSLAKQTYPASKFNVIVVDNGSTPAITLPTDLGNFDTRIERCSTPGAYAARNAGVKIATGELLAFTDADCIPDTNWLTEGVNAVINSTQNQLIGGEVKLFSSPHPTAIALYQSIVGFQQRENIEIKGFSATANLFCSREQFNRVGLFEERLLSGGDREWAWRATKKGITIRYAPNAVVETFPRATLRGAIRQARRVAAGRRALRNQKLDWIGPQALQPHRTLTHAILWIWRLPDISIRNRIRILLVATLIKATTILEEARINLGGKPERR